MHVGHGSEDFLLKTMQSKIQIFWIACITHLQSSKGCTTRKILKIIKNFLKLGALIASSARTSAHVKAHWELSPAKHDVYKIWKKIDRGNASFRHLEQSYLFQRGCISLSSCTWGVLIHFKLHDCSKPSELRYFSEDVLFKAFLLLPNHCFCHSLQRNEVFRKNFFYIGRHWTSICWNFFSTSVVFFDENESKECRQITKTKM